MSFPRYPKYKDSGVEWLGEVPEHWETRRAGSLGIFSSSGIDKTMVEGESRVQMFNYLDVYKSTDKVLRYSPDLMTTSAPDAKISAHSVCDGDLLITPSSETRDDIGHAARVISPPCPIVYSYHLVRFRLARPQIAPYLAYAWNAAPVRAYFESVCTGTTRKVLVRDDLRNAPLAIPPIPEQAAIAAFLDRETAKIDALIAEQQRLIELLQEKRQAVISHAVTKGLNPGAPMKDSGVEWLGKVPEHWTLPPLYVRFDQVLGKMLDHGKMTGAHPTPYLRNQDVRWDYINVDELPVMDIAPHEQERFTVKKGDLLMVEGRELGRSAIWSGDDGVVAFQKALHRLRPRDETEHMRYFYYLMIFVNATGAFMANQSPNEIPHLTGEQLRKYRFPKPPYTEQVAIARDLDQFAERLDSLCSEAALAITLLQERRSALISAAVTGQIDVRGLAGSEAA